LKESEHHGHSLQWDGFIFFFSLLCGLDKSSCLVSDINYYYLFIANHLFTAAKNFSKVCQNISFTGNDSRRISEFFDKRSKCG